MFCEEFTVPNQKNLSPGHPLYYLEDMIKRDSHLNKKDVHDEEHSNMLLHWGCNPLHTSKLTFRDQHGVQIEDRLYHIMLHLRYWKEGGDPSLLSYVTEFEERIGFNLDELTLPSEEGDGWFVY